MGKGMKLSFTVKNFFFRVINMKAWLTFVALVFTFHFSVASLAGQDNGARSSKDMAYDAWNRGNYKTAYYHFNGLLLLYSRDPLYKYYTGACLVKMEGDIPRAVTLLGSAINNSVNIKSVPADVWFYYGRALQMSGSFTQASDAYRTFVKNAGKKLAIEYEVQEYLDQCVKKQGEVSVERIAEPFAARDSVSEERIEKPASVTTSVSEERTVKPVNARTSVYEERRYQSDVIEVPDEYETKLAEAMKLQNSADSVTRIAQGVRKEMETASREKQEVLLRTAEERESEAAAIQAKADFVFLSIEQPDLTIPENRTKSPEPQSIPVNAHFMVLTEPAYSKANPVPIDIKLPAGLIYTIQLAAFKKPVQPSLFRGLYPLYGKLKPENGITFYYAGIFRTHEAARQALAKVREEGLTDAFIIALMDDIRISLERAAMLEKKWAGEPLPGVDSNVQVTKEVTAADTLPVGTLAFRAEVMRSKIPLKPEVIEKIELLAGNRGLDMIKNNQGETVCLIGNFITFESADEYVSLLIRNGYSTARVAAYVGMQEISVGAAKELLNKLE